MLSCMDRGWDGRNNPQGTGRWRCVTCPCTLCLAPVGLASHARLAAFGTGHKEGLGLVLRPVAL
eukprot:7790866-Lingulodinium_polyedra.AAC.1